MSLFISMTRINAGIPPCKLSNKHLLAEHREMKRIPNAVSRGRVRLDKIPKEFCLGTGHVSFFYDKLGYLLRRYKAVYNCCRQRGLNVQDYSNAWDEVPSELMGDYVPTFRDNELITNRIKERNKQ